MPGPVTGGEQTRREEGQGGHEVGVGIGYIGGGAVGIVTIVVMAAEIIRETTAVVVRMFFVLL